MAAPLDAAPSCAQSTADWQPARRQTIVSSRQARIHKSSLLGATCSAQCRLCPRLCCKSRKLQGHEFFVKTQNWNRSPIRTGSIALPKTLVSLARGDEVPHISTRKPRPRPAEFLRPSAKRLLQHNLPCMDGARGARENSDISASGSGAAMYAAFECGRCGRWP